MNQVLTDLRAEQGVAATALVTSGRISDAILDRVHPDDFADVRCREVMHAVVMLREQGADPEWRLVAGCLRSRGTIDDVGGERAIEELTLEGTGVGSLPQMCELVAALGRRRRRVSAANALAVAAVVDDDPDAWDSALGALHEADGPSRSAGGWASPHDIADRLIENLQGRDPVRWPWPLHRLNHLSGGGARRGQMTFIGGASSHGKSAFVDCALQSMANAGANTVLFLNEMTVEERAERIAANLANVRYSHLQKASAGLSKLTMDESKVLIERMANQRVGMVACANWTCEQIIREARRRHAEVMALDIVQKLPFQPGVQRRQTFEDAVQRLDAFAKDTGCHVIIVGQINRERANGTFPIPGLPDIKDCAELGNGPDNVLFVWREQDPETLDPLDQGVLRMAKYRGAALETIPVTFQGQFQRWTERALVHGVAA